MSMYLPPETIETERLILRMPVQGDASLIFNKYAQDHEVVKFLVWRPHENLEVTKQFVDQCIVKWQKGSTFAWVVVRKSDRELIGMFELRIQSNQANFGYVLAKEVWGKGYATETAKAIVDLLLKQEEIKRIWAVCDCDNLASARVLEKAGLVKKRVLEKHILHPNISNELRDCFLFERIKAA